MKKIIEETKLRVRSPGREAVWVKAWTDGEKWSHGKGFYDQTLRGSSRDLSKVEFIKLCRILEEMGW